MVSNVITIMIVVLLAATQGPILLVARNVDVVIFMINIMIMITIIFMLTVVIGDMGLS